MPDSFLLNKAAITHGRQPYLLRTRIHNLLKKAVQVPLVVVVAGAGYGKTQAVYSFLREYETVKIWLQISALDNLGWRFWENFVQVIASYNEKIALKLRNIGFPESTQKFEQYLAMLKKELLPTVKYTIVFDDFHLLHEKTVLRFIKKTIAAYFPNMSIIVISRTEPECNVVALLSKGLIFSINENDLMFEKQEMLQYLKMLDISLLPPVAEKIYADTGGWAFAISLIALTLKNSARGETEACSAMKLNIFKLIESEIFSVASPAAQRFLIQLSLVEHLPLALLQELAPDEALIEQIGKMSSFIRYDSYTNTYRLHHLFLEYLCRMQDRLTEEEKRNIYQKAAVWSAANDYKIDAITYYEKAGDYRGVVKIAYRLTLMTPKSVAEFLLATLARIPPAVYDENVELYIIQNKALQSLSQFEEAAAQAQATIKKFETLPPTRTIYWLLSECHLQLGYIGIFSALYSHVHDHGYHCERGHHYFLLSARMVKGPRERALISAYINRIAYPAKRGDLLRVNRLYSTYAPYVSEAKNGMLRGTVELAYAEIAYFQNDLKNAERFSYQAVSQAREQEQFQVENRGLFFLLRIHIHRGNVKKIQEVFRQWEAQLEHKEFFNGYTIYDIAAGWFFAHIGQTAKIADWLKNDFEKSDLNSLLYGPENVVRSKFYLAEKRYHAGLALLESGKDIRGVEDFLLGKLEIAVMKAVCLYHIKDKENALRAFQEAYDISRCDDLEMPFIEMGKDMQSLARAALEAQECLIPRAWLESIRRKASTYAKKMALVAKEYAALDDETTAAAAELSQREMEVLNSLALGLTREEIAASCYISVNTVKVVIKSIYNKLGAVNRADAIRLASALNLISGG